MNAALLLALLCQIQVRDEPKDWSVLATPHFDIHYPSEALRPRAGDFAGWFEAAYKDLAAATGIEPPRVQVFLYRSFHDLLQAGFLGRSEPLESRMRRPAGDRPHEAHLHCRPRPRDRALALAEPTRNRILIHCQASDRWNAWFARHELAHQFQFAHLFAFRIPSWLIVLKDPLTPIWWWEGGADYLAGIFDSGKDQFVRDLADERLYSLSEMFFPDVINPHDFLAVYYEGSYFWRFLDEKYGPGTARKLFDAYDEGIPTPMNGRITVATGRSRDDVERDFRGHLQAQWKPMMEGRGAPSDRLTDSRTYYRLSAWGGRWSPDGKRLAWVGDSDVWPELYVDGRGLLGWRRGLDVGFVVSPPSWSPDGKRLAVIEWTANNRDVLLLAGLDGDLETIPLPFDELYAPAWSPDGTRIAFSALKNGTGDLYILHLADRRIERVTEDPDADSSPAWSADGRLAWIKETAGRTVLHLQGKGPVTNSWAQLESPQWSRDGKSVVVAADVGGVYDAFSVDPETGRAMRLTRFRGGVSHPSLHPDGSLLITYQQGRAQDLYRVKVTPQEEPAFAQEERKLSYGMFEKQEAHTEPKRKSRVFGVDWLMFPTGSLSYALPGFEFEAADLDAENRLAAAALFQSHRLWQASATVANTRWRPTFGATAGIGQNGDLEYQQGALFADYPLLPTLTTGASWTVRRRVEDEDHGPDPDFTDSGPTLSVFFSNELGYRLWDPGWGFSAGASASLFGESFGGDRSINEYFVFLEGNRTIVHDWILWMRATYEKLSTRDILESELLGIEGAVRGAEDLDGLDRASASAEFRFPLWRDLLWSLDFIGAGEFLIIKDLRGFVFADAGAVGIDLDTLIHEDTGAASTGAGLRLDFSVMPWPLVNARVPTSLEVWWALVGQEDRAIRGTVGFGFRIGF